MKKTAKRLLSMALALVMVLSLLPATALPALAAENAGLKHAMAVTLEHVSVTDAGQAGVAAMIINDALHHSDWPQPITRAGEKYHSETVYRFSW